MSNTDIKDLMNTYFDDIEIVEFIAQTCTFANDSSTLGLKDPIRNPKKSWNCTPRILLFTGGNNCGKSTLASLIHNAKLDGVECFHNPKKLKCSASENSIYFINYYNTQITSL
jgi:hypothetical protein